MIVKKSKEPYQRETEKELEFKASVILALNFH